MEVNYKKIKKVIDKDEFSLEHIETAQARDGSDIISIIKRRYLWQILTKS